MHMTHSPAAMTDWLIKPLYALLSNQHNEISPSRRVDGPVVFGERPVLDGGHAGIRQECMRGPEGARGGVRLAALIEAIMIRPRL